MFEFSQYIDRIACISSTGRQVTYGELEDLAGKICEAIEPHRLVFCMCSNTVGSIAGYVACLKNEDAVLLLDAGMSRESFDELVRVYRPAYIWAPKKTTGPASIWVPNKMTGLTMTELEEYVLWKTEYDDTPVAENLAVLLATSGSTGSPKVVRLTKVNLRSNAFSIIEYLHITSDERPILGLPMNYAFGLSIVNSHLMTGATLLLTERPIISTEFVQFAIENGFTSYSGVPFAFETIRKLSLWKQRMPSLRTLTMAGGMPSKELVRFFDETLQPLGKKLYVMYGQAEATARIAYLEPEFIKTKAGSIGKAIPGGEISLEGEDGEVITSPYVVGELVYKGKNVCLGYAEKAEDLLKGDENQGVIHTGDMGYRDSEGFYFITGRKGRFVKLFGSRLSLDHLEDILHPVLADCACVGDDRHITIYTTDNSDNWNDVIDGLSLRTKVPRKAFSVCHIDKIPRSRNGKVQYTNLINQ